MWVLIGVFIQGLYIGFFMRFLHGDFVMVNLNGGLKGFCTGTLNGVFK